MLLLCLNLVFYFFFGEGKGGTMGRADLVREGRMLS